MFERIKYDATQPAMIETPPTAAATTSPATPAGSPQPEPATRTPACTPDELAAIVASDPRTAGAVIVTAPMPPRLIERSYATPSLLAHIASDKLCDGLPLHRQEDRFARLDLPIDRGTMCGWLEEAGGAVGATIVEAMRKEALASAHCIATDAPRVRVQPEPRADKQSQPCQPPRRLHGTSSRHRRAIGAVSVPLRSSRMRFVQRLPQRLGLAYLEHVGRDKLGLPPAGGTGA